MSDSFEHEVLTDLADVTVDHDPGLQDDVAADAVSMVDLSGAQDLAAHLGMSDGSCACDCSTPEGVQQFTDAFYTYPQNPVVICQEWPQGVTSAAGAVGIPGISVVVPGLPVLDQQTVVGGPGTYDSITITGPDGQPVDQQPTDASVATVGGPGLYDGITITGPDGQPVDPAAAPTVGVVGGPDPATYTTTYGPGANPDLYPADAPSTTTAVIGGPDAATNSGSFTDNIIYLMSKTEPFSPQWNQLQGMLDTYNNMIRVWVT